AKGAALPPPIYVYSPAGQLSDVQIEALLDATLAAPLSAPRLRAGVVVATSSFPSSRGKPLPDLLQQRLAAHLHVQRLDRDPIEAGSTPSGSERPPAASPSLPAPEPTGLRLPAGDITALVARGDVFLAAGDVASARLFFQRAADAGDSRAAMRMAVTFDAAFL